MKKIHINSKTIYNFALFVVAKRGVFLIFLFGAMLVYNFDIIYKNAYLKIEYVDYSNNEMIFDGRKESVMIGKITDNLKLKDEAVRIGLEKKHKNIFVYEDEQSDSDISNETDINSGDPNAVQGNSNVNESTPETVIGNIDSGENSDDNPQLSD